MPELAKDLEKLILRAGIDGALTEDAVAQFHALVKERDALKTSFEHEEKVRKEEAEKAMHFHQQLAAANQCLEEWAGREQDLMDRESKCTEMEIRKECADLRVKDHKEMFTTVFRNSVLRKEVMTPTHPSAPDQYGTRQEGYPSKDTTEEEET